MVTSAQGVMARRWWTLKAPVAQMLLSPLGLVARMKTKRGQQLWPAFSCSSAGAEEAWAAPGPTSLSTSQMGWGVGGPESPVRGHLVTEQSRGQAKNGATCSKASSTEGALL